jgi:hypothetical protein
MIRIESDKKILEAFRDIDRDQVQLPSEIAYPFGLIDYYAWTEPSGHRAYLLYNDGDNRLLGVVFKRLNEPADAPIKMCSFCHSVRGGGRVGLLSVAASKNRIIGLHLCRDLSCKEKVQGSPKATDLPEKLEPNEKLKRVLSRMGDFLRTNLF